MTTLFRSLLALVLVLGGFGATQTFADINYGESFRRSCRVVYEDSYTIEAYCRTRSGYEVYNRFDRQGCVSDISNNNGTISCVKYYNGGLPAGSYLQSCTGCQMSYDGYLECLCRDGHGGQNQTSIYVPGCRGPIDNIYGRLSCG